jgi:predicted nucleotidyltransferase
MQMLRRLIIASARLTGPLGRRVLKHRGRVREIVASYGASNVRVFGSVACGSETDGSDIDLLVDLGPRTGLFKLARLERDLTALLQAKVDVIPAADLKRGLRDTRSQRPFPCDPSRPATS